jgi:hypothetical protein
VSFRADSESKKRREATNKEEGKESRLAERERKKYNNKKEEPSWKGRHMRAEAGQ